MATSATLLELETPVEERITRLESDVAHMRADVSELKIDIKKLDGKIESVRDSLGSKVDAVKDSVTSLALTTERAFGEFKAGMQSSFGEQQTNRFKDRVGWLVIGGAILGVMAHGFKWL